MELTAVLKSYRAWAPIYDKTFGAVSSVGRRRTISYLNTLQGRVLEVGIGTGMSLEHYAPHLDVTGIDVSPDMLRKARSRVDGQKLHHVTGIHQMDARALDFPDDHFDAVVAMFLISVVPEPEKVISEMARVCKKGGEVVLVNHFARDKGALSLAEKAMAPFAATLGWHSDFEFHRTQGQDNLVIREQSQFPPMGLFTFLRMEKQAA